MIVSISAINSSLRHNRSRSHWAVAHKQTFFLLSKLSLGIALSIPAAAFANTDEQVSGSPTFSTGFLQNGGQGVDLGDFLQGSSVAAGTYRVDINVNRTLVGRQDVLFAKHAKTGEVQACLTLPILESLGLNLQPLRDAGKLDDTQPEQCYDLSELIEHSSVEYDTSRQQLNIGVPQASMLRSARGYVDPALWDEGVTAGFINYNFTGRRNTTEGRKSTDGYTLGLNNGINLGPWRLRNESNLNKDDLGNTTFNSNRTFAQRDITSLKSQLTLGTAYTDSSYFDSVRIKGALLASDDAMLPDSQRGYAPTVRGDADTNATVEIRQNGYLLYTTNVAPGPFVIDDIYPNGSNGDLEITVIEADGRRRVTTQAFASLPKMVRKGTYRQNLAIGKYDSNGAIDDSPTVGTGGLTYGLTDNITVFGGVQWAPDFSAVNLGATQNTPFGAFSADITQSSSTAVGQRNKGQSARVVYAKTLASTDTTFTLGSYRYSTDSYRTLTEHMNDLYYDGRYGVSGRAKSRFNINVNQTLGGRQYGYLTLSMDEQRYWNLEGKTQNYRLDYNNNWGIVNYSLGASHTLSPDTYNRYQNQTGDQTRLTFTVSFPLGSSRRPTNLRTSVTGDNNGAYGLQNNLSGAVMGRDDAYYSVNAGHESESGNTLGASISGTTPVAQLNAGYSQGDTFKSFNAGASGAIVAHAGGINLGQRVGETFTLVEVPGVTGTPVGNYAGVTTGANGYAVLPYAQPYRTNWVKLDSSQMGADVEIDNPTQQLIPRRGSVTVARFAVNTGRRVQFELVKPDGTPLPFGASVENAEGEALAITDPTGNALVLVNADQGTLKVKSGAGVCEAAYSLPERTSTQGYDRVKLVCQ